MHFSVYLCINLKKTHFSVSTRQAYFKQSVSNLFNIVYLYRILTIVNFSITFTNTINL